MTFKDGIQDAKHMVTYMFQDFSIGMLYVSRIVFHPSFSPWGDRQRDVIPTLGLFCCASKCQMHDPTALKQELRFLPFALAMHVRLMMQPAHVCRPQRGRSSLHHREGSDTT